MEILFLLFLVYAVTATIRRAWYPERRPTEPPPAPARRLGKVQASLVLLAIVMTAVVLHLMGP